MCKDFKPGMVIRNPFRIEEDTALVHQVGGNHYKQTKYQPIEVRLDWNLPDPLGDVIKYLYRYKYTKEGGSPIQDLKKARHFLDIFIEHIEKQEEHGSNQSDSDRDNP